MVDPLVVYVIVRNELGMSPGKTGIQMCHSIQYLMEHFFRLCLIETKIHNTTCEHRHVEETSAWSKNGSTKIGLRATDKQWDTLKEVFGKECFIVRDAGKTEVKPGTETCMVLWPVFKSQAHPLIQELPLL
jgi:peptidyl-tRNA hydrolase